MSMRIFLLLLAVALVGCSEPQIPEEPPMPTPKRRAQPAEEAEEEIALEEEYVYSPVGKRDPFRSYLDRLEPAAAMTPDPLCGPLCNWELEQLRLVAVISGMATPIAMLEDPQGNGHSVRRGTSVGKRNGKVTEILRDRIIVTEYRRLGTGEVVPAETEIVLRGSGSRSAAEDEPLNLLVTEDGESIPE